MSAAQMVRCFGEGAQAKRGGIRRDFAHEIFDHDGAKKAAWWGGYDYQSQHPSYKVSVDDFPVCFDVDALKGGLLKATNALERRKEMNMTTRTAEELEALKTEYRTNTYDPYAAEAQANGQEPQAFEEAFAAHLAALDAEAVPADAPVKPKKADKPKAAKPKKADKPAKEKKPRGFRASSEDRKVINAAAAKVAAKAKAEGKVRCLPQDGQTYTDFLQGKVLKLDADGNGSATLDVVPIKDSKAVGTITVTVKSGVMSAK